MTDEPALPRDLASLDDTIGRFAIHEAGHAVAARFFDLPIASVTIIPTKYFGGFTAGGPGFDPAAATPETLLSGPRERCGQALAITPGPGEPREDVGAWLVYVQARVIECAAGRAAEVIAGHADEGSDETDLAIAREYAATICVTPGAVEAFLSYAAVEARELLRRHWHAVEAVWHERLKSTASSPAPRLIWLSPRPSLGPNMKRKSCAGRPLQKPLLAQNVSFPC